MININIQDNHINIGIIGTGRIAARFLEESSYVSGINVSAIYNHTLRVCYGLQRIIRLI